MDHVACELDYCLWMMEFELTIISVYVCIVGLIPNFI